MINKKEAKRILNEQIEILESVKEETLCKKEVIRLSKKSSLSESVSISKIINNLKLSLEAIDNMYDE